MNKGSLSNDVDTWTGRLLADEESAVFRFN